MNLITCSVRAQTDELCRSRRRPRPRPKIGKHTEDGDEREHGKEFAIKAVRKPSAFVLASHAAARARNSLHLGAPLPPNSRRFAHEVRISGYFRGSFRR
jgi:hypothetical protein